MDCKIKIGDCEVGGIPKIIGVIGEGNALSLAKIAKEEGADILEARIDLFDTIESIKINHSLEEIRKATNLPIIGTIRKPEGGGLFVHPEEIRKGIFFEIIDNIDAIDIELFIEERIRDEIINNAKSCNKAIIVSYHNFYSTPSIDAIKEIVKKAMSLKGMDILKIAVMAEDIEDVVRLLNFTKDFKKDYPQGLLCTISMGNIGRISRIAFPFFGSCLTYGSVGLPVAPGQIHIRHLRYVLKTFRIDAKVSVEDIRELCERFAA